MQVKYDTIGRKLFVAWLDKQKLSINQFSKNIGHGFPVVWAWTKGRRRPDLDMAILLQKVTDGSIPCEAWEIKSSPCTKAKSSQQEKAKQEYQ